MNSPLTVAIVGATGAVGQEFLNLFESRDFPVGDLRLLASARSAGKTAMFRGKEYAIQEALPSAFEGVDVAFFSAGATRSRDLVPAALEAGALVVDNSSAFRMRPDVPLTVPEINLDDTPKGAKLVAVPNCSAILLLMAVHPLRSLGKIERLIVSTYQSASGGGAAVMEELRESTRAYLEGRDYEPRAVQHPYAFNLFSHNTAIGPTGANEEETKVVEESRKILGMPELKVNVTCVRVPVLRAHSESVTIEFDGPAPSEEEARVVLAGAPGVKVVDERDLNLFPMPAHASGQGDVLVGRIRQDPSNPNGLCLFLAGDQLLKGAALNAVQIAEALIERDGI
ncbi:aspartate-semialdehyde dehydrogenase [bacterium]|nr:MAG: aspartate-semialdehyde dehydrogenase [bacterium]